MSDQDATRRIRAAIAAWGDAFCSKDLDRLMALYAPTAVVFDAIPPFASGVEAMRDKVASCLPHFPDASTFAVATQDLSVSVAGEIAAAHFVWHFSGLPPDHPAGRHWLRSTMVWRRQADDSWLIVHDHCSAPFDPHSEKVVLGPDLPAPHFDVRSLPPH
ncbi:MAG: nuclear transport factor 2 family protein [Candidatus Accumulibacter sp.]|uniref:YybH family protein n=1 Tax=Accumulibacter sp. TaxID=2053492 RepID=UPI001DC0CDC6|nr:nuclear transport factor 2 family protein [Accumulibacter sp.]MCB1940772.1 nuclear transport factor 2 family protein [Accumulibacter sp.]MCP5248974.1 nuclear transport factor 2 family protein [Accumulibacter sp.]